MLEFYIVKRIKDSRVYIINDWEHDSKKELFLQEIVAVDWEHARSQVEDYHYDYIPGHGYYDLQILSE